MLVKDPDVPGGERVKLLDFGIAKLQSLGEASPGLGSGITQPGVIFGTPTYMSPEQIKGAGDADGQADVYSLGVIFYQMLAGQPPFTGEGVGVVAMHLVEEPQPIRELVPTASNTAVKLTTTMLMKNRNQRPTMEQIASTLRGPVLSELYQSSANLSLPNLAAGQAGAPAAEPSASPGHSNTLGRSNGQQISSSGRRPALWFLIGGIAVLLGSGSLGLWLRQRKPAPAAQAVAAVHWSVVTEPPGATIRRSSDGTVLGVTPWTKDETSALGAMRVRVNLDGYRQAELSLDRSSSTSLTLHLEQEAKAPPPGPDTPPPPSPKVPPTRPSPAATASTSNRPKRPSRPASSPSVDYSKRKTKVVDY